MIVIEGHVPEMKLAQIIGARGQPLEMQKAISAARANGSRAEAIWRVVFSGFGDGLKRSGRTRLMPVLSVASTLRGIR